MAASSNTSRTSRGKTGMTQRGRLIMSSRRLSSANGNAGSPVSGETAASSAFAGRLPASGSGHRLTGGTRGER